MAKFSLGRLCATAGVAERMQQDREFHAFVWQCLSRYREGDWGDMTFSDKRANDDAVACGDERILASYKRPGHPTQNIWIITEADRSATTVLFPDEY